MSADQKQLDELLPREQQEAVVAAIGQAERLTIGQIKVHLEARCPGGDPYRRAVEVFDKLGLARTKGRTAVLLYVAALDHRFAVVGDTGIHSVVGEAFWRELAGILRTGFQKGALGDGLVAAILTIGERLREKLPPDAARGNELDDAIST